MHTPNLFDPRALLQLSCIPPICRYSGSVPPSLGRMATRPSLGRTAMSPGRPGLDGWRLFPPPPTCIEGPEKALPIVGVALEGPARVNQLLTHSAICQATFPEQHLLSTDREPHASLASIPMLPLNSQRRRHPPMLCPCRSGARRGGEVGWAHEVRVCCASGAHLVFTRGPLAVVHAVLKSTTAAVSAFGAGVDVGLGGPE